MPKLACNYSSEHNDVKIAKYLLINLNVFLLIKTQLKYFETAIYLDFFFCRMGPKRDVDTTSFRRAIWNYIHCMYGIRHDDYNYGEVNQLLERKLKSYIKTLTCYPERVTKQDYDHFMRGFKHSEKVSQLKIKMITS